MSTRPADFTPTAPVGNADGGVHALLDAWIDAHFDEQVAFLQQLVRVPTDTPPGDNAPHAERTAELLATMGFDAERHAVPTAQVEAAGLQSIVNLVVRRRFGDDGGAAARSHDSTIGLPHGPTIGLNAHGDVVPPGTGWTHDPYGGEIDRGRLYGRASAVSKCDFATYTFAIRALEAVAARGAVPLAGTVELYFTYDEEIGGELGPGFLLQRGIVRPDLVIAAGFSYQVVTAHNGCLQLQVTVHGTMGHAAVPETAVDALQAATKILVALYEQNVGYRRITSSVPGITHPYLNVGRIDGGTHTNVVPGSVELRLDRRMIPEEDPVQVEAEVRQVIAGAVSASVGITVEVRRLLLARALQPLPGNRPLVQALCRHASEVFGETVTESGTPLYTDARLFGERGIPAVLYGCGPRTLLDSHAKRADEHIELEDLRRATRVVARTLADLLTPNVRHCTAPFGAVLSAGLDGLGGR